MQRAAALSRSARRTAPKRSRWVRAHVRVLQYPQTGCRGALHLTAARCLLQPTTLLSCPPPPAGWPP